ncbi:MAG: AEC family transporter [Rhodobacteraceae bacterium]|nr:AEC family transporter [Paracoccaceae bacterium]
MDLAFALFPMFMIIVAGYALVTFGIVPKQMWPAIELLCFRVLIPIVLIDVLYSADLSLSRIGPFGLAMLGNFIGISALVLVIRFVVSRERLSNSRFTTIFQTATRWNAFIAFAAADQIGGPASVALIAVGVAVLIPLINVTNIGVLAAFGPARRSLREAGAAVVKNPLVISCAVGTVLNLTGLPIPDPLHTGMAAIGAGAPQIGLLVVGAGIRPGRLFAATPALWAAVGLRQAVSPGLFLLLASMMGLTPLETFSGALVLSVPAATNGYIVARQMGGDAELYADALMWQTAVAVVAIPLLAVLVL